MTRRISTGAPFEAQIGYSRAVVTDGWVFVSGTTGYDYAMMQMPETIEAQCRNILQTLEKVLKEAGSGLAHVVRVTYILPDGAEFEKIWPQTSAAFATALPAATMIEARLMNPQMKLEIEVTARQA